jgi:hypothetical protein
VSEAEIRHATANARRNSPARHHHPCGGTKKIALARLIYDDRLPRSSRPERRAASRQGGQLS